MSSPMLTTLSSRNSKSSDIFHRKKGEMHPFGPSTIFFLASSVQKYFPMDDSTLTSHIHYIHSIFFHKDEELTFEQWYETVFGSDCLSVSALNSCDVYAVLTLDLLNHLLCRRLSKHNALFAMLHETMNAIVYYKEMTRQRIFEFTMSTK